MFGQPRAHEYSIRAGLDRPNLRCRWRWIDCGEVGASNPMSVRHRLGPSCGGLRGGVMPWESGLQLVVSATAWRALHPTASPARRSEAFESFADTLDYFPADRPLICNLSGAEVPEHRLLAGRYWRRHATEHRASAAALQTLSDSKCDLILELGPQPTPPDDAAGRLARAGARWLPSLVAGVPETASMLKVVSPVVCERLDTRLCRFRQTMAAREAGLTDVSIPAAKVLDH